MKIRYVIDIDVDADYENLDELQFKLKDELEEYVKDGELGYYADKVKVYLQDDYCIAEEKKRLKRLIPKKPIPFKRTAHDFCNGVCEHSHYPCEHLTIYNHEYQYTDYKCPLCKKRVSDGNPNNCCHCGQALDWSGAK